MVHQPRSKREQSKRGTGAAKSNRRPNLLDAVPDVPPPGLPSGQPVWVKRDDGRIQIDQEQLLIDQLLGRPYISGRQDCGSLIRDFYFLNFGLQFPDYARPDDWWRNGMNLFSEIYQAEGFRPVDIPVDKMQPGDIMLMAYGCAFPNHSALYIGGGKIVQHLHGKLSSRDHIRSHNRDALLAIVRHPDIIVKSTPAPKLDLVDMLSPYWKGQLSEKLGGLNADQVKQEIKRIGQETPKPTPAGAPLS